MVSAVVRGSADPRMFALRRHTDSLFSLALVALVWLGIALGFGPEMIARAARHADPYPWIVPVHAAAYVAWLLLLTAQITLAGSGRLALHVRLGTASAVLVPLMVVLGIAAALVMDRYHLAREGARADSGFLWVQLQEVVTFAVLAAWGLSLRRRDPPGHRRLMLLATFVLSSAGFGRWLAPAISPRLAGGGLHEWIANDGASVLLALAIGFYDIATRGRVHRRWAAGTGLLVVAGAAAYVAHGSPAMQATARGLLGA